jgi:hypothetical protein
MAFTINKCGSLKISEAQFQRTCVDLLRSEHWYVRPAPKQAHLNRGCFGVLKDEPDLMTSHGGKTVWFELKTAIGKLSRGQIAWHQRARLDGERVYVIRSIEQLRAAMRILVCLDELRVKIQRAEERK